MEDSGEGKPAEPRRTTEEVEEEMGSAPEEEMKSFSDNDFCSVDEGGAVAGASEWSLEETRKHYCKECDKSFSCGKALGGHMSSAHAQANKGIHGKKRDFKNQHKGSSGLPLVACRVCGKRFKSNKSLYGHMKNHPDRNWRGVSPPPEARRIDSPPHQNMNDLAWPVTAKRGRASSKLPDNIEEGVCLAAQQLLQLLNSNNLMHKGLKICEREARSTSGTDHEMILDGAKGKAKIIKPEDHEDSSSSSQDDAMFDVAVRYPTTENGNQGIKSFEPSHQDEEYYSTGSNKKFANGSTEEQTKQPDDGAKVIDISSKNKSKMASKAAAAGGGSSSSDSSSRTKYVYSVCGQRFDNHKALGGHKASHNRFKINIYNKNGKPTYATSNGDVSARKPEQQQAGAAEEEPEVQVESKILDFDLNESPRCDDAE